MIGQIGSALGFGAGFGAKALARAVGKEARRVVALTEPLRRALEHAGHEVVLAELEHGRLPLDDGAADALCASGPWPEDALPQLIAECARVVKPGGRVLLATPAGLTRRGPARHVVCAAFLHAGLLGLEQRLSRGVLVTTGRA